MKKRNEPLISIIVPIYNVELYVSKCIESILSQTYINLDIILINDGSTDSSGEIANYFAKQDKRITLVHKENNGLASAWNTGLNLVQGELIGFVDSDDWIEKDMFSILCKSLLENDADISVCGYHAIDIDGNILFSRNTLTSGNTNPHYPGDSTVYIGKQDIMRYCMIDRNAPLWCNLFKKALFQNIRFPLNKTIVDNFVVHHVFERAEKILITPVFMYNYLQRPGSETKSKFSAKWYDWVESFILQYKDLHEKYPNLAFQLASSAYQKSIEFFKSAFLAGKLLDCEKETDDILKEIRKFPSVFFNISSEDEILLKLVLDDLKYFVMAARIKVQALEWRYYHYNQR